MSILLKVFVNHISLLALFTAIISSYTKVAAPEMVFIKGGTFQMGSNDSYVYTAPVAQFKSNGLGLYDMNGNVWEWCEDWYHSDYNGAPADGSAWLSPAGSRRVVRGGAWVNDLHSLRATFRLGGAPGIRYDCFGFRIARTN